MVVIDPVSRVVAPAAIRAIEGDDGRYRHRALPHGRRGSVLHVVRLQHGRPHSPRTAAPDSARRRSRPQAESCSSSARTDRDDRHRALILYDNGCASVTVGKTARPVDATINLTTTYPRRCRSGIILRALLLLEEDRGRWYSAASTVTSNTPCSVRARACARAPARTGDRCDLTPIMPPPQLPSTTRDAIENETAPRRAPAPLRTVSERYSARTESVLRAAVNPLRTCPGVDRTGHDIGDHRVDGRLVSLRNAAPAGTCRRCRRRARGDPAFPADSPATGGEPGAAKRYGPCRRHVESAMDAIVATDESQRIGYSMLRPRIFPAGRARQSWRAADEPASPATASRQAPRSHRAIRPARGRPTTDGRPDPGADRASRQRREFPIEASISNITRADVGASAAQPAHIPGCARSTAHTGAERQVRAVSDRRERGLGSRRISRGSRSRAASPASFMTSWARR